MPCSLEKEQGILGTRHEHPLIQALWIMEFN